MKARSTASASASAQYNCQAAPAKKASTAPRVPKFLRCLYDILFNEDQTILSWAKEGTHFQIYSIPRLEVEVLPKYFKHGKFASFQRQLNNFGFRKWTKTQSNVCTFSHHHYVRCHPDKLVDLVIQHGESTQIKAGVIANAAHTSQHGKRKRTESDSTGCTSPLKKASLVPFALHGPSIYDSDMALWDMVADITSIDWSARANAMIKAERGNVTPTSAAGIADLRFDFTMDEVDDIMMASWPSRCDADSAMLDSRMLYPTYPASCQHTVDSTLAWENEALVRSELEYFMRDATSHSMPVEPVAWGARM